MTATFANLRPETVARLADQYGFGINDLAVVENAEQADRYHGTVAHTPNHPCAPRGTFDAALLLDCYLSQEAYSERCEARSHRAFCSAAYGE